MSVDTVSDSSVAQRSHPKVCTLVTALCYYSVFCYKCWFCLQHQPVCWVGKGGSEVGGQMATSPLLKHPSGRWWRCVFSTTKVVSLQILAQNLSSKNLKVFWDKRKKLQWPRLLAAAVQMLNTHQCLLQCYYYTLFLCWSQLASGLTERFAGNKKKTFVIL